MNARHPKHVSRANPSPQRGGLSALLLIVAFGIAAAPVRGAGPVTVLVTADAEGHLGPCETCPTNVGHGGLARRATLVARARAREAVLLLDAGNWLAGAQSAASGGEVITTAYDAIGYDVVHVTPKDLYFGKARTLALVGGAKFSAVSATLLDAQTGRTLFQPYVVKDVGGQKIAVLGVSEPPPGLESLPLLQSQLAGIRLTPVVEAIDEWLAKARQASDRVVVLYQGNGRGLRALRAKLAGSGALICVAGVRPETAPDGEPLVVATELHGKSLGRVAMTDGKMAATQVDVAPDVPPAAAIVALLDRSLQREAIATVPAPTPGAVPPGAPTISPATAPSIGTLPAVSPPTTAAAVAGSAPPVRMTEPAPAPAAAQPSPPPAPPAPAPLRQVTAHPNMTPKGLPGVGLSADQVNAAIERGRDFLWGSLQAELAKEHRQFGQADTGFNLLEGLALVHAGAQLQYPAFDAMLRGYLDRLDPVHDSLGTYQMGILCMLIGDYADPKYLPKMRLLARSLVEQQLADGSWHYGRAVPENAFGDLAAGPALSVEGGTPLDDPNAPLGNPMVRALPFEKHDPGDNSTSQFAMLGLRAAARVRVRAVPDIWQRGLQAFKARQCKDGGWGYESGAISSYGSMTCSGICSIAIARHELGEKEPAADPAIEAGLGWLDAHFSVTTNPEHGGYLYYYLYSLERVGRILDTEFIGSHEWYPLGAQFLVGAQRADGSWLEANDADPRAPTSFALLFLTRATQSLDIELKRGGAGQVTTSVGTPPPARLYVILDASGSMLEDMDGRQKFDIARGSVQTMLDGLPDSAEVALRVYGHHKRSIEPGSDEDTMLEFSMGKIDRPKLASTLQRLRPRGKTPLALSLQQAKQDLASLSGQPVTVVLLTDGGEDTTPRRDPVKAAAELATAPGITFHIVGFDINQDDWGRQMREMAAAGHGHYWPAARANALERQIRAAVFGIPDDFAIYDASAREVARGQFGQTQAVPEGKYLFKTRFAGRDFQSELWVNTGAATGVIFDASRVRSAPTEPATQSTPDTQAAPAVAQRFCTHCGQALPPGAKFCPHCGQPIQSR